MRIHGCRAWLSVLLLVLCLAAAGCVSTHLQQQSSASLLTSLANSDQADQRRLALLDELRIRPLTDIQKQRFQSILCGIVGSPQHSPLMRQEVLAILACRPGESVDIVLAQALLTTPEPEMQERILDAIEQRRAPAAVPALVRFGAERFHGDPEGLAHISSLIEHCSGQTVETAVCQVIAQPGPLAERIGAVAYLVALAGPDAAKHQCREICKSIRLNDIFLGQVAFWLEKFDYLATNPARLWLCTEQWARLTPEEITALQQRVQQFRQNHAYTFDPRDSYLIMTLDREILSQPRSDLVAILQRRLGALEHASRPPSYDGAPDDYDEQFATQNDTLSYGDLLRMSLLLDHLAHPATAPIMRDHLLHDESQFDSEQGGLCLLDKGQVRFISYEPGRRGNDSRYVESQELRRDACWCLARWHCHADPSRKGELTGPGVADLEFAAFHNACVVVVSWVDDRHYNVDYFNPEGVVIDLGVYDIP